MTLSQEPSNAIEKQICAQEHFMYRKKKLTGLQPVPKASTFWPYLNFCKIKLEGAYVSCYLF